jgi:hypothetical protein
MPESEMEYAVLLEGGEVMQRPSLDLALSSVTGIRSLGGAAVLLSRTVVRSDWAEDPGAELAAEFGVRPDQITLRGCSGERGEEWGDA